MSYNLITIQFDEHIRKHMIHGTLISLGYDYYFFNDPYHGTHVLYAKDDIPNLYRILGKKGYSEGYSYIFPFNDIAQQYFDPPRFTIENNQLTLTQYGDFSRMLLIWGQSMSAEKDRGHQSLPQIIDYAGSKDHIEGASIGQYVICGWYPLDVHSSMHTMSGLVLVEKDKPPILTAQDQLVVRPKRSPNNVL